MPGWLTSPLRLITAARLIRSRACRGCVPAAGVQRAAANLGARGCSAAAPCPGRAIGEQPCRSLPVLHRGTGVSWGSRSSFPKSRSKIHPFFQKPQSQLLPAVSGQVWGRSCPLRLPPDTARATSFRWQGSPSAGLRAARGRGWEPALGFLMSLFADAVRCVIFFCLVALQKCRETSGLCDLRLRIAHVFLSGGELVPCFRRQAAFINTN